ncbi:MAG: hypothetical protein QOE70_1692 [Chthoniobacter sp.]|jgi:hypothetical protein|nr:hypothetical protein [Chthoniobacter sp.]
MTPATLSATSVAICAALLVAGCADLPPGQTGVFGSNGAVIAGDLAHAGATTSAESQATGSAGGAIVTATIVIIAKHQATERQRQIAQARARVAVARLRASQARATVPEKKAATAAGKPVPTKKAEVAKKAAAPRKLPRYIAVDTEKDERTAPQAKKSVVIFDTETQEIVGNNVYDVKSTPPVGGTAKFETYTAEYVGTGS